MTRIAYLGPGTFSEEASKSFFADYDVEYVSFSHINEVFAAVDEGRVDYSVIPIENTIEGSVSLHVDLLVYDYDIPIQAEWSYQISMALVGFKSATSQQSTQPTFEHIRKIVSYPIAMAQCRSFIQKYLPQAEFEQVSNTAAGSNYVKTYGDESIAAIAPASSAKLYGLDVLAEPIQEHQNNFTRFVLIGHRPLTIQKAINKPKTTLLVALPEDYPGALHQVLSAFAWRRINLSKIESRPTKKKLGNYYFYIDVEASLDDVLLPAAIEEITAIGCQVRTIGSYPSYI